MTTGWLKLYDFQREALDRIQNGCILCGGVGSGKSITSIAYYYILNGGNVDSKRPVKMRDPKDLYIITTARKRDTKEWETELAKFRLHPSSDVNGYSNKVVIDSWNNIGKYTKVHDAFFIFDEQRVIGYGAWTKNFLIITRHNRWILLSATPGDTWLDYMPVFIANGFYRNKTDFYHQHVIYQHYGSVWTPDKKRYLNTGRLIRLRDKVLIDMHFTRVTEQHHEDVYVPYDIRAYKDISRLRWNPWKEKPIESATDYCYALRRVVNSSEARQVKLLEIFEDHPKIIVFYNFDYELDILRNLGYGKDVEIAEWNSHKHEEIPKGDTWVYLVQYNAGAEGWNCISTDTIIFYSQNYSYKMMQQASGRIDRLNTPFIDLYYYHLKSRSGIDLAISKALSAKRDFNLNRFYRRNTV